MQNCTVDEDHLGILRGVRVDAFAGVHVVGQQQQHELYEPVQNVGKLQLVVDSDDGLRKVHETDVAQE